METKDQIWWLNDRLRNTFLRPLTRANQNLEEVTRFADMFSAMGTESRLRIMQLLLSAHPDCMVVGEIGEELEIPSSTLSHPS